MVSPPPLRRSPIPWRDTAVAKAHVPVPTEQAWPQQDSQQGQDVVRPRHCPLTHASPSQTAQPLAPRTVQPVTSQPAADHTAAAAGMVTPKQGRKVESHACAPTGPQSQRRSTEPCSRSETQPATPGGSPSLPLPPTPVTAPHTRHSPFANRDTQSPSRSPDKPADSTGSQDTSSGSCFCLPLPPAPEIAARAQGRPTRQPSEEVSSSGCITTLQCALALDPPSSPQRTPTTDHQITSTHNRTTLHSDPPQQPDCEAARATAQAVGAHGSPRRAPADNAPLPLAAAPDGSCCVVQTSTGKATHASVEPCTAQAACSEIGEGSVGAVAPQGVGSATDETSTAAPMAEKGGAGVGLWVWGVRMLLSLALYIIMPGIGLLISHVWAKAKACPVH